MFEWTGLPDSLSERFINMKMYEEGKLVFFKDKDYGLLALPVLWKGLNFYNDPTSCQAFSTGYTSDDMSMDKCVIMWNNYSRTPLDPWIQEYARRLMEATRTIDVNIHAQNTPVLILTDEQQRLTLKNVYVQYEGHEPVIYGNKSGFDKDAIQVLKTDAPYVADKIMQYKHDLWNEVMSFLGVGNAKQDKKERLVAAEVSANDEQIEMAREIMLKARQDACEKINKMFGTNISVKFKTFDDDIIEDNPEEGIENG
jgi:hypothetical protein